MRFDILTIFPEAFESYFNTSIIKRAQAKKLLKINIFNLRKWTKDKHQTVDDRPYGGGAGMIFTLEPIFKALKDLKKHQKQVKTRVILFSLKGKKLTQKKLEQLKKYDRLILICPHYEGVDERVAKYLVDEEISIGDYILTGGELPAMILVDAITRLIPGAIKEDSLKEESFSSLLIKNLKLKIKNFGDGSVLIALPEMDKNLILATRNLANVETIQAKDLNALDLLSFKYLLMPKETIKVIKETFKK